MTTRKVIDVSHFQNFSQSDFDTAKANGVAAVIIKVSEGATMRDGTAASKAQMATQAGLLVSGYHFMEPAPDGASQADNFIGGLLAIAKACGKSEIFDLFTQQSPMWIDVENAVGWANFNAWTRTARLCNLIKEAEKSLAEHMLGIYTNNPFWSEWFSGAGPIAKSLGVDLSARALWIAAYHNPAVPPSIPALWPDWLMWQYTDHGDVLGVDTSLAKW